MNKYESIIIVDPNLSESELSKFIAKTEDKIEEFAKIIKKEDMGIKKLAYEINKNHEGHYYIYELEVSDNKAKKAIAEIERFYRISDEIIKFLNVKQ